MKHLALLSLFATLLAVGCTGNDKTSAGLEGNPNAPPPAPVSADTRTQPSAQSDSAANGGFNLPASAPYQGNATATQNVNPAPFLAASQSQAAGAAPQNKAGATSQKKPSPKKAR
jgi:hypothetical protein